jgi:hypothetical protein
MGPNQVMHGTRRHVMGPIHNLGPLSHRHSQREGASARAPRSIKPGQAKGRLPVWLPPGVPRIGASAGLPVLLQVGNV